MTKNVTLTADMRTVLDVTIDICNGMEADGKAGVTSRTVRAFCRRTLAAGYIPADRIDAMAFISNAVITQALLWSVTETQTMSPQDRQHRAKFKQLQDRVYGCCGTCVRVHEAVKAMLKGGQS